jgi:hypothetical protein
MPRHYRLRPPRVAYVLTSVPAWRGTLCAETNEGYFDLQQLQNLCAQRILLYFYENNLLYLTLNVYDILLSKNNVCIVVSEPGLHSTFFRRLTDFPPLSVFEPLYESSNWLVATAAD